MNPKPDTEAAIAFLDQWHPDKWVITAIDVDKKGIETKTFYKNPEKDRLGKDSMFTFIDKWNGKRNMYFTVNSAIGDIKSHQKISQIQSLDCFHVDIDPKKGADINEERSRALGLLTKNRPKGVPEPSVIIFSGGGYQAFWRLKIPIQIGGNSEIAEDVKTYNLQLETLFSADHCHNVNRIMRLPGTINLPNADKRAKGQVEELALLTQYTDVVYEAKDFMKQPKVQNKGAGLGTGKTMDIELGEIPEFDDTDYLDQWDVSTRLKIVIVQGRDPDKPKLTNNTRSEWLFDAVCNLIRRNVPNEVIYAVITNKDFGISESILDKNDPHEYAMNQLNSAHEKVKAPELREMNSKHAVIGNLGGACRVVEEVEDETLGRKRMTVSTFTDVTNRYMHRMVEIGHDEKGKPLYMAMGKWWLHHKNRRQYGQVVFRPGMVTPDDYNLWQGFAVVSREGNWSLFHEHLFVNVCQSNKLVMEYLLSWMARTVQKPNRQGEVAIVLKGGRGAGKSKVATVFGSLFGRHMLHISNSSHLVGNFNAHLRDTLFLFADEAFFAGDKKHESVLKTLITEQTIAIESKGVDVQVQPNYIHLMMASNQQWVIPAGPDERRFLVLELGERNKKDLKFFAAIDEQMNNGGREGLLYDLLRYDISGFEVRKIPYTEALSEQKRRSLGHVEEWWYGRLVEGRILHRHVDWEGIVTTADIYSAYAQYVDKWKILNRNLNETIFGKDFSNCAPMVRKQRTMEIEEISGEGRPINIKRRVYVYEFPELEECRKFWEKRSGPEKWPTGSDKIEELTVEREPF